METITNRNVREAYLIRLKQTIIILILLLLVLLVAPEAHAIDSTVTTNPGATNVTVDPNMSGLTWWQQTGFITAIATIAGLLINYKIKKRDQDMQSDKDAFIVAQNVIKTAMDYQAKEIEDLRDLRPKIERLQKQVADAMHLKDIIANKDIRIAELETEKVNLHERLDNIEEQLEEQRRNSQLWLKVLETKNQERIRQNKKYDELENKCHETEIKLREAEKELEQLRAEVKVLRDKLEKTNIEDATDRVISELPAAMIKKMNENKE